MLEPQPEKALVEHLVGAGVPDPTVVEPFQAREPTPLLQVVANDLQVGESRLVKEVGLFDDT